MKPYYEQGVDYRDGLIRFEYVCLRALAADAAYAALRHVRLVRLTLTSGYRMLWLESMRLVLRTLRDRQARRRARAGRLPPMPVAPPNAPGEAAGQLGSWVTRQIAR